jgi:hypothetical protein
VTTARAARRRARADLPELSTEQRDRRARFAQIRKAGDRSRQLERERKARLAAETAAILANPQPRLRKRNVDVI